MDISKLENWPLVFISIAMLASAIIDWWKFKVPNRLTFPVIFSGWLLGIIHSFGVTSIDAGRGYFLDSFGGTFLGLALLLPIYAIGGMGAGDAKMTMGFGSWIGVFYGFRQGSTIIIYSFCAGAIAGGIIGLVMILLRGNFKKNFEHTRQILVDLVTLGSFSKIAEKAHERRSRWHRLPYGVPLCIGFLGYLYYEKPTLPPIPNGDGTPHQESRIYFRDSKCGRDNNGERLLLAVNGGELPRRKSNNKAIQAVSLHCAAIESSRLPTQFYFGSLSNCPNFSLSFYYPFQIDLRSPKIS